MSDPAGFILSRRIKERHSWIFVALSLIQIGRPTEALNFLNCSWVLGMQNFDIPDSAITASSYKEDIEATPASARIRQEIGGGAWCPDQQVKEGVREYLQIDLGVLKVIKGVETQGRFINGQAQEFADQYYLEYQREDDGPWFRFKNRRNVDIFPGNTNAYIAEIQMVDPPVIARRIRFYPYSIWPMSVCMRVEMYGCTWTDGVVSYSMRQGEQRGTEVNLNDATYDGSVQENQLTGGMGQLTDGSEGQSNFRLDPDGFGIKGYNWIGWRNESFAPNLPVEINFKFDASRNFSQIRIHCNNMFSKDVRVFRMAKVSFSEDGVTFGADAVRFNYMADNLIEYARAITIQLNHHTGRFIKLLLYFGDKWLMISEVSFVSEYVVVPTPIPRQVRTTSPPTDITDKTNDSKPIPDQSSPTKPTPNLTPDAVEVTTSSQFDGPQERQVLDDQYIGIIIGALAALIIILFSVILFIICRHRQRRQKQNNNQTCVKPMEPRHVTLNLNDLRNNTLNGKLSNGNTYSCVATSDADSDREAENTRNYAVHGDITKSSLLVNLPTPGAASTPIATIDSAPINAAYQGTLYRRKATSPSPYAMTEVKGPSQTIGHCIESVSGGNVYAVPGGSVDLLWTEEYSLMELPRDNLQFIEKLGGGLFGEVHLCEAVRLAEVLGDDFLINRAGSSMLVAVKMLRQDAAPIVRSDFDREVKLLARLRDPNIVRALGVVTHSEPVCVVIEYMKHGDLHQFLNQHVLEGCSTKRKHAKVLSNGCLIYMASQAASGMKYLESLNVVHRDLAARNCLVGFNYTIKISDFGMSRSVYSGDYYRLEGRALLPIRWMAWESIFLGKFSSKSDVWSFGVTLWEILTFARMQPYDTLPDEQVIENCNHFYHSDGLETTLPQPTCCPREIYDLMQECWNRDELQRPAFREIHMFLQRKNMGYKPSDDMCNGSRINMPLV